MLGGGGQEVMGGDEVKDIEVDFGPGPRGGSKIEHWLPGGSLGSPLSPFPPSIRPAAGTIVYHLSNIKINRTIWSQFKWFTISGHSWVRF